MCAGTSENPKNTEFWTIVESGLGEAYPHRGHADLAYRALKDTHTEQLAALGSNRGRIFRRTGWSGGPVTFLKIVDISRILGFYHRETLEKWLDKFTRNAQRDYHTSIMIWLPIVGGFIAIGAGGDENDQSA